MMASRPWPDGPYRFDDISTPAQDDGLGYIYPADGRILPTLAHTGDTALPAAANRALGHLFAAAPELFEALEKLAEAADACAPRYADETGQVQLCVNDALAALAKARGGRP